MIDLKLSYNIQDVYGAFNAMGEEGRVINIYSTLILDTIYPILYVSLILGTYMKLFSKNSYVFFIPILAGLFDLLENFQSVIMNMNYSRLDETQVALARNHLERMLIVL